MTQSRFPRTGWYAVWLRTRGKLLPCIAYCFPRFDNVAQCELRLSRPRLVNACDAAFEGSIVQGPYPTPEEARAALGEDALSLPLPRRRRRKATGT